MYVGAGFRKQGGRVALRSGNSTDNNGAGGAIDFTTGLGRSTSGNVTLETAANYMQGKSGSIFVQTGSTSNDVSGSILLSTGTSTLNEAGSVNVKAGDTFSVTGSGGLIALTAGASTKLTGGIYTEAPLHLYYFF